MFTCLKGSSVWELKAFVMYDFQGSSCQRPHRRTRSLTRSILLALILIFKILHLLSRLKNRKIRLFYIYTIYIDLVSAVQNAGYVRDN